MSLADDGYFNDLSRQPPNRSESPTDPCTATEEITPDGIARPRRIACVICRKRKLKCDGTKPSCGTCSRLGHKCAYDEVRKKSGPKRGYVKELEARLAQVETQLKSKDGHRLPVKPSTAVAMEQAQPQSLGFELSDLDMGIGTDLNMDDPRMLQDYINAPAPAALDSASTKQMMGNLGETLDADISTGQSFSWEMIGLGLDEPLPHPDMIDELHEIYFEKIHPSVPMIHKYRYFAAMNLAPHMRPPVCLRYAMWALASSVTEKYFGYEEVFYHRARKYAESDEMRAFGEGIISVAFTQTWVLLSSYEFKMMYFPRAWMSTGRAVRSAQMLGLHRLDGDNGLEIKQCLPMHKDWTDLEERRRTFWSAYCADRYASIGTGWPLAIDERDIATNLPTTEEAFEKSRPQTTQTLTAALTAAGASSLSPFAGIILMACLFGRNLTHLHRPEPNDNPEDQSNGGFWKRHRALDTVLLNTSLYLPSHLRLPAGVKDPKVVFLNMNIHTSTICLHQAAILAAQKHDLSESVVKQSTDRCFLAACEIVDIMRLVSHIDVGGMNPYMSFGLFVAARVLCQAFKKMPDNQQLSSNLEFLLEVLKSSRKKNRLTESFLLQLIVDLEGSGLEIKMSDTKFSFGVTRDGAESMFCTAIGPKKCLADSLSGASEGVSLSDSLNRYSTYDTPPPRYTTSTFTVPTREQRPINASPHHSHSYGIICEQQDWPDKSNGPTGPVVFEADMMVPDSNDHQSGLSDIPTPTTSNRGSSSNSYSPLNGNEGDASYQHLHPLLSGPPITGWTSTLSGSSVDAFVTPPTHNHPEANSFSSLHRVDSCELGEGMGENMALGETFDAGWMQMMQDTRWDGGEKWIWKGAETEGNIT